MNFIHFTHGATDPASSTSHAAALLVVHDRVPFKSHAGGRLRCHGGMGCMFEEDDHS